MLPFRSRFPDLSSSSQPGFPCLLSDSVYLAFCQFLFILPSFASHSCSTGDHLSLSPSVLPLLFRFLSSASFPVLITQPLPFPFPSSPLPLAWVLRVPIYPFPFQPVAMPSVSLWYSAFLHFFSPLLCFATQVLLQSPTSCFQHGRSP